MTIVLFAGIAVSNFEVAMDWYVRLFGDEPTFMAHETEAVWELREHRFIYVHEDAENCGHSEATIFLSDLDTTVAEITARGIQPVDRETFDNGVRKITYRDRDGNEIGYGGAPLEDDG